MGYFMGPGDDPIMDRVYITKGTGATVKRYRHVVTPLVYLGMHAARMHCAGHAETVLLEHTEAEHLEGEQANLERHECGVFEVTDRDMNEVPPYQNDEFVQQVQHLAAFDHVRAAPPAQAEAATAGAATASGCDWSQGEHPKISKQHNHGPCLSITQDFHAQDMSNFASTPAFESRQYLGT